MNSLDLRPEIALSQQKLNGMILTCFENERPLGGMLGYLDWRFNGYFSKLLKAQVITGKKDEIVYAPLLWNDRAYSFLILGMGANRRALSKTMLESALKKMNELQLTGMGIAASECSPDSAPDSAPDSVSNSEDLWVIQE